MKTKTKTKTVKAWAFASESGFVWTYRTRARAVGARRLGITRGAPLGPVVRVEVPAPRAAK